MTDWIEGPPPRESGWHYEVLIDGQVREVQRVDSSAPLSLAYDYGSLVFSGVSPSLCDEALIVSWRRTDQPVSRIGTWVPSMYA